MDLMQALTNLVIELMILTPAVAGSIVFRNVRGGKNG